jgi:hypothetical protein
VSRRPLAACAALAVLASVIAAGTADGQSAGRTLHLTASDPARRDVAQLDVRPRGLSAGDRLVAAQTLRSGGRNAGRLHTVCTVVDASYHGQDCTVTLILRDGQLTAQGGGLDRPLRGVGDGSPGAGDPFAVTGGTGAYAGAGGTLLVRGRRVTLTLGS